MRLIHLPVCQFSDHFLIAGLLGQLVGSLVGFREAMRVPFDVSPYFSIIQPMIKKAAAISERGNGLNRAATPAG